MCIRDMYVAASFVRSEDDVMMLRDYMDSLGYEEVEIISKIENQSGVRHIDGIIQKSDGIMVARGDMGVEIPFIKLPAIQKMLINKCLSLIHIWNGCYNRADDRTGTPKFDRYPCRDLLRKG